MFDVFLLVLILDCSRRLWTQNLAMRNQLQYLWMMGSDQTQHWEIWASWNLFSRKMARPLLVNGLPHVISIWCICSGQLTILLCSSGNSSQVSDGAGAVLLMKRSVAMQKGLPILGVFRFVKTPCIWISFRPYYFSLIRWFIIFACVTLWLISLLCSCRSFAAVGVDPAIMGIGPAVAIPAAVKSAGLEISDIDLYEINEVVSLG